MTRRSLGFVILWLLGLFLGSSLGRLTALAQTTASLTGQVTDPDGAVVAGAPGDVKQCPDWLPK